MRWDDGVIEPICSVDAFIRNVDDHLRWQRARAGQCHVPQETESRLLVDYCKEVSDLGNM